MNKWNKIGYLTIEELTDTDFQDLRISGITTLEITFRSIGYYQPASMYGGPDHVGWPEEGEDERTNECVKSFNEDGDEIFLTQEQQNQLFDKYQEQINKVEIDIYDRDDRE